VRRELTRGLRLRAIIWLVAASLCGAANAQEFRLVSLGSAGIVGNYYAFARELCRTVNAEAADDLRCSPDPTSGSLYNLYALHQGELDFALVQSDWLKRAVEGTGPFAETGPLTELRSVMSLYPEALTLLARREAGIRSFRDLEGERVDIGHPSTARRGTTQRLLDHLDLPQDYFGEVHELSGAAVIGEICAGQIDAIFVVYGHPSPIIGKTLKECDLVLVPLTGPRIGAFLDRNTEYTRYVIPADTYPGVAWPIETFSVSATLVARADVPAEIVERVTATILEDYERLRANVRVLPAADPARQTTDGLTAPIHEGAKAAFAAFGG